MTTDYKSMAPETRWKAIERMAPDIFGTNWKGKLAECYGITPQAVTKWKNHGAPLWVAVAVSDLYRATLLERAIAARQAN